MNDISIVEVDVLVIGSGIAGLRAAIQARKYVSKVLLVDKTLFGRQSLSSMSGGTIGIVTGYWSLSQWQSVDEMAAWHILGNAFSVTGVREQRLEYIAAKEVVVCQDELYEYGVANPRSTKDYAVPGRPGWAIIGPLVEYIKKSDIQKIEKFMITDLIRKGDYIFGAIGFDIDTGKWIAVKAKATVLATGGAGEVYQRNNTPVRATGDGYAMAFRAGLQLSMMEFVLFDAWICAEPGLPQFWIPPSYARTLGVVRNNKGDPFLKNYIPTTTNFVHKELRNLEWGEELVKRFKGIVEKPATLDINDPFHVRFGTPVIDIVDCISRGMAMEVERGRGDSEVPSVYLDFSKVPAEAWLKEPKGVQGLHLLRNHDWKNRPVRMFPGALGNFGGVVIDENCATSLKGLYAAGEVTYDVDSLRHSNVFGVRAGDSAGMYALKVESKVEDDTIDNLVDPWEAMKKREHTTDGDPREVKKKIKKVMQDYASVIKTEEKLRKAIIGLDKIKEENLPKLWAQYPRQLREALEAWNMLHVGEMIAKCALLRRETRGTFNRLDYPKRDDIAWIRKSFIVLVDGDMKITSEPLDQPLIRFKLQLVPVKGMEE